MSVLHHCLDVTVREISREHRKVSVVAATERGVDTWQGREHLRMSGADLGRYRKNPVLLDSHNRYGIESVIGSAMVKVDGRTLAAELEFAPTPRGQMAFDLYDKKFLRAVSIGFIPRKARMLNEGETDGEGDDMVKGPCRLVTKWELVEVSAVVVPADEDALRRSIYGAMEGENVAEKNEAAPAAEPARAAVLDLDSERMARDERARRDRILAVTPRGLEGVAERSILEGKTFEETRAVLLAEHAKRSQPVGTPDPTDAKETAAAAAVKPQERSAEDLAATFMRAFPSATTRGK